VQVDAEALLHQSTMLSAKLDEQNLIIENLTQKLEAIDQAKAAEWDQREQDLIRAKEAEIEGLSA